MRAKSKPVIRLLILLIILGGLVTVCSAADDWQVWLLLIS
jgi:hypothetical protein